MKKIGIFFLLITVLFKHTYAQDEDSLIECNKITHSISILDKSYGFIALKKADPSDINNLNFTPLAKIAKKFFKGSKLAIQPLYIKFTLGNISNKIDTIAFSPGYIIKKNTFYKFDSLSNKIVPLSNLFYKEGFYYFVLQPNEKTTFYVEIIFNKRVGTFFIKPVLINKNYVPEFSRSFYNIFTDVKTFGYILSGILLMMILFTFTNYVVNKRREFLYYGAYSLSVLLLVFFHAYLYRHLRLI